MDAAESRLLIVAAGGDKAFAELLGITSDRWYAQRVNNWKRRGIPSDVVLQHLEKIRALQAPRSTVSRSRARA